MEIDSHLGLVAPCEKAGYSRLIFLKLDILIRRFRDVGNLTNTQDSFSLRLDYSIPRAVKPAPGESPVRIRISVFSGIDL